MPTVKQLEQEISDLNRLLLEFKEHADALGHEREQYKEALKTLMEMVLKAEEPNKIKNFANNEVRKLISKPNNA